MSVEQVVDSLINLLKVNLVAKTNVASNVHSGSVTINVDNSFHFKPEQEIILIDDNYNKEGDPHYQVYECAKIKQVNNTSSITLEAPVVSDWDISNSACIQKTIGHSPLYDNQILYGDREVIASDAMTICLEPASMSNEWIYFQGGLSQEYKIKITIYGKDVNFEEGRRILDRYSDATVDLLNSNIHVGVATYFAPLTADANIGDTQIKIEDNSDNRDKIVLSSNLPPLIWNVQKAYQLQDNQGNSYWYGISNVQTSGSDMLITLDAPLNIQLKKSEYAVIKRLGMYLYDSRASDVTYGVISKGSAILRASEINWFGKYVKEYKCPQLEFGMQEFKKKT